MDINSIIALIGAIAGLVGAFVAWRKSKQGLSAEQTKFINTLQLDNGRLREVIAGYDATLEELRGRIDRRDSEIDELKARLDKKDEEIDALQEQLAEKDREIEMRDNRVQALEDEVDKLKAELKEFKNGRSKK